jgi:hypothetical protein
MKIVGICGFTFYAIEPAARLPSRGSPTARTEDLETEKGYLAFLEIENADEKEVIQNTLRGVADPRLLHPYEKGLVIWCIDSTMEKKDVFDSLCEAGQSCCKSPQSKLYSAEQFFHLDRGAFEKIVKEVTGLAVSSIVIKLRFPLERRRQNNLRHADTQL